MKTLLTAVILDWMGSGGRTPEEEFADVVKEFSESLNVKLDAYQARSAYPGDIREGTDLVLFDFGGVLPGTDMPDRNAREIVRWAENHPSALVVVISEMTYEWHVKQQMEQLGLTGLHNVVCACVGEDIPKWFKTNL
jgi:hypothetical protein